MTVKIKDVTSGFIKEIEALKSERDELRAHVEALKYYIIKYQELGAEFILNEALLKTPQQCLRDIQAEAGRSGYHEGFTAGILIEPPAPPPQNATSAVDHFSLMIDRIAKVNADKYADKIRQGVEK